MSTPTEESWREHPSTYFIQDRSNRDELRRLALQDQLITTSMGGVLPEQAEPERLRQVLDVGCGTGGWLIEVAKAYPNTSLLIGADVSKYLVDYAREQAKVQQLSARVEFHVMDALRMLEFPSNFFDLVNLRFAIGYMRTWDWPKLLQEFQRVARPGGIIRLTESEVVTGSNSVSLMRPQELGVQALHQAGHAFYARSDGLLSEIPQLLRRHGFEQIQTRFYELGYRANTPDGQLFIEDMKLVTRLGVHFLRKWIRLPDDYEETYQQAQIDMERPDFIATFKLLTVWGQASVRRRERAFR